MANLDGAMMTTTPTAPLTLDAAPEQLKGAFPARILSLLKFVADRNPPEGMGPYEDEHGKPMQDDADVAIRWLTEAQSALSAQAATIAQLEARLREAEAVIGDHNAGCQSQCEQRQQNGTASCPYAQYGKQCPDCPRDWLLDAAIAAHGKDAT